MPGWIKGTAIPLTDILVENSPYNRASLKKRLLKDGILLNKCHECGIGPSWNDKLLVLQIDHINGINNDNRLENLRILCPNCHTQTNSFAGKRFKRTKIKKSDADPNWNKQPQPNSRKVEWPTKENLEKLLWQKPTTQIAKDYGVSDKAVAKWAKSYKLTKPPRGYWAKVTH
jgi:Zn finger protein HypA/HybF involved in hydrogenase expression